MNILHWDRKKNNYDIYELKENENETPSFIGGTNFLQYSAQVYIADTFFPNSTKVWCYFIL